MMDTFHFRKSQLNKAVSHGVLAGQGPPGPFSRTSSGRRRPISPRAGGGTGLPALFIHVISQCGLHLHGPLYPHTLYPALRLSLGYPVKVAGMMVRPRMEGDVERREWGCLSLWEVQPHLWRGLLEVWGSCQLDFTRCFFKLLKKELTTSQPWGRP